MLKSNIQTGDKLNMKKTNDLMVSNIDIALCIIISLAFSSSSYYISNGECEISVHFLLSSIYTFYIFLVSIWAIRYVLRKQDYSVRNANVSQLKVKLFMEKKHSVILLALFIFICWLPILLILYPGTAINDTWAQLRQFIGFFADGKINKGILYDHHPIFDTLYMGIIIVPIVKITGRWHIAMFVYVLIQAFCTSISFACTIEYAYKKLQIGIKGLLIMALFYCVIPIYPASVQTISKDALFSWIYVLFFILFLELVRSKGECLDNKKYVLRLIVTTILCCLTKKVGMYIVLGSLITVFIFQKRNRKRILLPITCIIMVMFIIMPLIKDGLGVVNGGKQEMFSLPFQQTARYVKYHRDDITEEEYQIIDKILGMEDLAERYDPIFADPVKGYSERGTTKDYIDYIGVWIKQGIRHPKTYISAFNAMVSGWFSWCEYKPLMNMGWHNQLDGEMIPEWVAVRGKIFEKMSQSYEKMFDNLYENPIIKIFLSYGLYASLIPAFAFGTMFRKWKRKDIKYWLGILPVCLSIMLGCWLAPVSTYGVEGMRYLYPLTYTTPMLVVWCIFVYKNNFVIEVSSKELDM